MAEPLLSVRELCVDYVTERGPVRAVDHVSFEVSSDEVLGVAGESGCGKSTIAQAILRILGPPAVISGGEVRFGGKDLLSLSESELREVRWRRIAMVFQSAMDALNPVISIGEQIVDTLEAHERASGRAARVRAGELLEMVGIPARNTESYAHQLSGGMRQRVGIALGLALDPELLILDEPTTALDVIVEREILDQITALRRERAFSVIFISHDLARMLEISDRIAVLYAARLAEIAPAASIRTASQHPYTEALLAAFPTVHDTGKEPVSIPGTPPSLLSPPSGCRFHPRCPRAIDACRTEAPAVTARGTAHEAACHLNS